MQFLFSLFFPKLCNNQLNFTIVPKITSLLGEAEKEKKEKKLHSLPKLIISVLENTTGWYTGQRWGMLRNNRTMTLPQTLVQKRDDAATREYYVRVLIQAESKR